MYYHRSQPLVYNINTWDNYQWKSFSANSPKTKEILQAGESKIIEFGTFSKEVFHRLHNHSPQKVTKVRPEAQWAVSGHNLLDQLPEWQSLEGQCQGDRFMSGVAATSFLQQLIPNLPTPPEQLANVQQMRQEVAGLRELKAQLVDDPDAAARAQEMIDAAIERGKEAVEQAIEYAESVSEIGFEFRKACEKALESVKEMSDAMNAFCYGGEAGEEQEGASLQEKMALGKKLSRSNKLQRIAKQAGRLKRLRESFGEKQKSECLEVNTSITSVEYGNNLSRMLATEFVNLLDDETFPLFAAKYVESQLLQYKLEGREEMGSGPIIILIDSSGSMVGEREIWAKAVCLNFCMVAQQNKRDFAIIHFDYGVRRTDYFPANKFDAKQRQILLDSMLAFYGGGTTFTTPLDKAVELIRDAKKELSDIDWKKADIVLLTDGSSYVYDDWLIPFKHSKQELKFTVYGVCIESSASEAIKNICDSVTSIADLAEDTKIASVLTSV